MPSITLRHVDIDFPFPPYPQQARFMESLLQALQGGANALLESPTGTGKVSGHGRGRAATLACAGLQEV